MLLLLLLLRMQWMQKWVHAELLIQGAKELGVPSTPAFLPTYLPTYLGYLKLPTFLGYLCCPPVLCLHHALPDPACKPGPQARGAACLAHA